MTGSSGIAVGGERAGRKRGRASAAPSERVVVLGPLAERLGYVLRRAQLAVFQDFDAAFAEVDIRPVQYSILTIVEHNPGLSQTQVAETLGIRKTNFVAMLDLLEARALVRRASTPGDRRTYAIILTEEGKAFVRKLHRMSAAHERRIVEAVGAAAHRRLFGELAAIARLGGR